VGGIDSELMPTPYPCIMGHEVIGTVVAAGAAVRNVSVGDRVGLGAQCHACLNHKGNCPECASGWVQYCRHELTFSIHSRYPEGSHAAGQVTQGGWADRVRCSSAFVFRIPAAIPSAEAAPLMCGGITVYAPLRRYVTKPGMKVGVVGIGGLGHMALLFAAKMHAGQVEVVAISHNSKKKADALRMGATSFIDTSDAAQVKAAFRSLDFVLVTANGSDLDFHGWLSMVSFAGTLCTVGLTKAPFSVHAFDLGSQLKLVTSSIGTVEEMQDMLRFAAEHQVHPIIEEIPMKQINEGIQRVRNGQARYRVVLHNDDNSKTA
jgi:D-arabinose 1-dehydrogenase-like Zn-dependent alcohol dehydrogenase